MNVTFTKSQLKKVGDKLRHRLPLTDSEEQILASFRLGHRNIIEAFRSNHNIVLHKAGWMGHGIQFVSRLKRRDTLVNKLADRHQQMDLSRMHDIAGGRIIFLSLQDLCKYRNRFIGRMGRNKNYRQIPSGARYDYLTHPKTSGYRGMHDVYEEVSEDSIRAKIEIQFRTVTQHAWATAVEIWDQARHSAEKFGRGNPTVARLFVLYSELLWRFHDWTEASSYERNNINLSDGALYKEICKLEREVGVLKCLRSMKKVKVSIEGKQEEILIHRLAKKSLVDEEGVNFRQISWDLVPSELFQNELDHANDLVFVQGSPKALRRAYNNYFNDPGGFVRRVKNSMKALYERQFRLFRGSLDKVFWT